MPEQITVRAAAKVNLHLGVGGPREDGFHPLETVYTSIGLYDDVVARPATGWSLTLDAAAYVDASAVPLDDANIVAAAARALAALHGVPVTAGVTITKGIPVAGGLAGGSADAAAALVALDRLLDLKTSDDDLLRLAADLGSDVPFALHGGHALGTGRGEVVTPLPAGEAVLWWVVVPSTSGGLSTPAVYRHFDRLLGFVADDTAGSGAANGADRPRASGRDHLPTPAAPVVDALAAGDVTALAAALHNDLQAAAIDLRPELGELIAYGEAHGALRGLVSGSGPTIVFLCAGADQARALAGVLQQDGRAALVANGPVAGAHIVSFD